MLIIKHQVNTLDELYSTDTSNGIEIDIRTKDNTLIIQHEPFIEGVELQEWLLHFKHKYLILNVKEDGLEEKLKYEMQRFNIKNFFFLDQPYPSIIKTLKTGERRIAARFSEYETIHNLRILKGQIDWVWIDHFTKSPLNQETYRELKQCAFKICLVSPELQGHNKSEVIELRRRISEKALIPDAVCTKFPQLWC